MVEYNFLLCREVVDGCIAKASCLRSGCKEGETAARCPEVMNFIGQMDRVGDFLPTSTTVFCPIKQRDVSAYACLRSQANNPGRCGNCSASFKSRFRDLDLRELLEKTIAQSRPTGKMEIIEGNPDSEKGEI